MKRKIALYTGGEIFNENSGQHHIAMGAILAVIGSRAKTELAERLEADAGGSLRVRNVLRVTPGLKFNSKR